MNIEQDQTFTKKGSVWREKDVKVESLTELNNVVVGAGSSIGETATITNSVIGRQCVIPSSAVVEGSIIWNNVTLGEGCKVHGSIIMEGNNLSNDIRIGRGTVLLPKTNLPAHTQISDHESFTTYTSDGQPIEKSVDEDEEEVHPVPIGMSDLYQN